MRLWSLHPRYLDAKGLVALWREGLLAQKVLQGKTKGYRNHPQLDRFKDHPRPKAAIATYLSEVCEEASRRGYSFDKTKVGRPQTKQIIFVTRGQLKFEWEWLKEKLSARDPKHLKTISSEKRLSANPFFRVKAGAVEDWEKGIVQKS